MTPPLLPLLTQPRVTRATIISLPARYINTTDRTTVSALSGTGSLILQTENGVVSAAAISNDIAAISNDTETDEDLAAAIEQFLRINDEGSNGRDSNEEGDEYIIHANGIENTEQLTSNEVEYSLEDDRSKVRDHT